MSAKTDQEQQTEEAIRAALAPRLAMAKTRQEKSREAATVLFFGYGIYPSAKTVHGYTQHGSLTDINADLREFWTDLREKTRVKIDAPALPDELLAQFSQSLVSIWDLAMGKAQATLDGERQEVHGKVAIAHRQVEDSNRLRQVAEDRVQSIEVELREERERRVEAERRAEAQATEITGLQDAVAAARRQVDAEMAARREAEQQFSRDLSEERTNRKRESETFDREIKFAKMQTDTARTAEKDALARLATEKSARDVEVAIYRQRVSQSEELVVSTRMELADYKGRCSGLEGRVADLHDRIKNLSKGTSVRPAAKNAVKRKTLRR